MINFRPILLIYLILSVLVDKCKLQSDSNELKISRNKTSFETYLQMNIFDLIYTEFKIENMPLNDHSLQFIDTYNETFALYLRNNYLNCSSITSNNINFAGLIINFNQILKLDLNQKFPKFLKILNLDQNQIRSIDFNFRDNLPDLEYLYIRKNEIKEIDLLQFNHLKLLNLSSNEISQLYKIEFDCKMNSNSYNSKAVEINLDNNLLSYIPKIGTSSFFIDVSVQNQKNDSFKYLSNFMLNFTARYTLKVNSLNLAGNKIEFVDDGFYCNHENPNLGILIKDLYINDSVFDDNTLCYLINALKSKFSDKIRNLKIQTCRTSDSKECKLVNQSQSYCSENLKMNCQNPIFSTAVKVLGVVSFVLISSVFLSCTIKQLKQSCFFKKDEERSSLGSLVTVTNSLQSTTPPTSITKSISQNFSKHSSTSNSVSTTENNKTATNSMTKSLSDHENSSMNDVLNDEFLI